MFDWFAAQFWSAALHWIAYWGLGVAVIGAGVAGAIFSPIFKTFFVGIAGGAALLLVVQSDLVSFKPKEPQVCKRPPNDPNGPACQRWHSTDDQKGYGYWEPCDVQ